MSRLFIRIYLALGMVMVLALIAVLALRRPAPSGGLPPHLRAFTELAPEVVRAAVSADDEAGRAAALAEVGQRWGYPIVLEPRPAIQAMLPTADGQALDRGQTVQLAGPRGMMLYVPLPAEPVVAVIGPMRPGVDVIGTVVFGMLVVALGITAGTAWLVRPLERDLRSLSSTAGRFGHGDLSARSDIAAGSAMAPLAEAFDLMADRVGRLVAGRQELLRAVSHELRGPLQRMRFALDLLPLSRDTAELEGRVGALQRDIDELDELVGELLDRERFEAGGLHLQEVEVGPALQRLAESAGRLRAGVVVELGAAEGRVLADGRAFDRLVGNLLSNAVRHAAGRVRVGAEVVGEGVRIVVDDDGPGIPEEQRQRIFEPFVRLDEARARGTGGFGLGLALARSIAVGHQSVLVAEASRLGGARFVWTLRGVG